MFETYKSTTAHINEGNGWSTITDIYQSIPRNLPIFIAPYDGIYYFSYNLKVYSSRLRSIDLLVNPMTSKAMYLCRGSVFGYRDIGGLDLISRGCLLALTKGDTVGISSNDFLISDMDSLSLSFKGFLYSPSIPRSSYVAWSVHNNDSITLYGSNLLFPQVLVNVGSAWSTINNIVTVTVAGVYYLEIVGTRDRYGFFFINLKINDGFFLASTVFKYEEKEFYVTRSHSILIKLDVGMQLNVYCVQCRMYGFRYGISFHGMLLYTV